MGKNTWDFSKKFKNEKIASALFNLSVLDVLNELATVTGSSSFSKAQEWMWESWVAVHTEAADAAHPRRLVLSKVTGDSPLSFFLSPN